MILAVTGWRHYTDASFIRSYLNTWKDKYPFSSMAFLHVRVGDADGADAITQAWCMSNSVSHHVFHVDWSQGKQGDPQRNARMLRGDGDHVQGPMNMLVGFPRTDGGRITVPGSETWGCMIMATEMGIRLDVPPYKRSGD